MSYTSPAGLFTAAYPAKPAVADQRRTLGSAGVRTVTFTDFSSPHHLFSVMYFDFTGASEFSVRGIVNDWIAPTDATEVSSANTTFLGLAARDFRWHLHGRYSRSLFFMSSTRFYVVQVSSSSTTVDGFERFRDSFHLND